MKRRYFYQNFGLILMPIMIPILILGVFSTILVQMTIKEEIEKNSVMTLTQVKNATELMFSELDTLSINFYLNASFVSRLKTLLAADTVDYDNANIQSWFSDIINTSANAKPYIHSVYLYYENEKNNMFVSNLGITAVEGYADRHWYAQYRRPEGPQTFMEARPVRSYAFEEEGAPVISVYKSLRSPGAAAFDGMIVMNIRQSAVQELLSAADTTAPQSIFLVGGGGTVLSQGRTNRITAGEIDFASLAGLADGVTYLEMDGRKYVVMQLGSNRYDLKYLSVNAYEDIFHLPMLLTSTTIALLVASFVLAALIAWLTTKKNNQQLRDTIEIFERVERGLPLPTPPRRDSGAYDYIQQQIIRTFVESSYLRVQLAAKKYKSKSLELMALQSQINPHFLFNTLGTIFWKTVALTGNNNDASRMIEELSAILQYSTSPSDTLVTLAEEIANTESYISIQKVRYRGCFEVIWEYDDALLDCRCIKLMFQPFIENSIYHGCAKDGRTKCYIKIKIRQRGCWLRIAIIDNGRGIPPQDLQKLRQKLAGDVPDEEIYAHIGIANTSKRLQLFFGNETGVHVASKPHFGTCIRLEIPIHEDRETFGDAPEQE